MGVLSQEDPTGPAQLHGKGGFHMGNSSPVLKKKKKKKKKRNSVLAFSVFQVHLTQKGQHARATYLGVVYSASLHW